MHLNSEDSYELKETYGSTDSQNIFSKPKGRTKILLQEETTQDLSVWTFLVNFFREVFLPQGYPSSVSDDYLEYQFYDTIQAFCSRITGTLTTKAILQSVGVGDAEATPLAAATAWIFKDGTGMFGSIVFAWLKGTEFDYDCKKWRLFADILNDFAMFIEMLLPYFRGHTMGILCVTTAMKAGVGVSGSATRAAITQHQAKKNNMADVSAKDGSQETAVNLLASFLAVGILTLFPQERFDWMLFIIFTIFHLYSNYKAVKCLKFTTLNTARFNIVLKNYFLNKNFENSKVVNEKESVFLGHTPKDEKLIDYEINMGQSLKKVLKYLSNYSKDFQEYVRIYEKNGYFIVPNIEKRRINVVFYKNETAQQVIDAYYNAYILGINLDSKLKDLKKEEQLMIEETILKYVSEIKKATDEVNFLEKLSKNGWRTDRHSIKLDEWRLEKLENKKND